jgi:hypothetical protein
MCKCADMQMCRWWILALANLIIKLEYLYVILIPHYSVYQFYTPYFHLHICTSAYLHIF